MTTEKALIMYLVFSLIQVVCMIGVILCENTVVDYSIIGFQVVVLFTQIGIGIADSIKSKKRQ